MAENPNQSIFDDTVRHRIALERYSTQDAKQVLRWLEDLKADIAARMVRATPGRRSQLEALLDDVRDIHTATYRRINDELTGRWRNRAGLEATFQAEKLGAAGGAAGGAGAASSGAAGVQVTISKLTTDAAYQAALSRPMDGAILSDWLTALDEGARRRLDRALTISWTEGESLDRAVKRMRETVDISKRGARTLVRTANTHISNAVQQASAEANADIVKEVEWRSVLDSRTSEICRHRDGKRYPVNQGPRPPAHPNCRSIVIEILDGFPPPQREIYSEWIARQPASVQDEVLGPTRGKLLRAGKYKVTEFTDSAGKRIPLKELDLKPVNPKVAPKPPPLSTVERLNAEAKDYVLTNGKAEGVEHIVAIDEGGASLIGRNRGMKSEVGLTDDMMRAVSDPKRFVVLHHNHPGGRSLSQGDLHLSTWPGVKEIWAHGHNGSSYVAKAIGPWNRQAYGTAKSYVERTLQRAANDGRISIVDANLIFHHVVNLRLERARRIMYRAELTGDLANVVKKNADIIEEALKGVQRVR